MQPLREFFTIFDAPHGQEILSGVVVMLELTVSMLAWGLVWGVVLTLLRALPSRAVRACVVVYVEFHRNVPLVVQLFLWYFGVPQLLPGPVRDWLNQNPSEFLFASIAFSSAFGAYVSEDLRSGIRAMDGRQIEAARALGFSYLSAMCWIVLPQALRNAAPALMNQALMFFKSTSLAMTIGVAELTYHTKAIQDETYRTYTIFSVATVIYLGISFLMIYASSLLGKPRWMSRS